MKMGIMISMSNNIVQDAWSIFHKYRNESVLVRPSLPILYFGDRRRFECSRRRIITVGLNPSKAEFPQPDPFQRFPAARQLSPDGPLTAEECATYLTALHQYFQQEPYWGWFNGAYQHLLAGLDADFAGQAAHTALHTDLCSPLPTDPTWSGLTRPTQQRLLQSGAPLWHDLVEELQPDLAVISIRTAYLDLIRFTQVHEWKTVYTVDRPNPYYIRQASYQLVSGKMLTCIFGCAAQLPFGLISYAEQRAIGSFLNRTVW